MVRLGFFVPGTGASAKPERDVPRFRNRQDDSGDVYKGARRDRVTSTVEIVTRRAAPISNWLDRLTPLAPVVHTGNEAMQFVEGRAATSNWGGALCVPHRRIEHHHTRSRGLRGISPRSWHCLCCFRGFCSRLPRCKPRRHRSGPISPGHRCYPQHRLPMPWLWWETSRRHSVAAVGISTVGRPSSSATPTGSGAESSRFRPGTGRTGSSPDRISIDPSGEAAMPTATT